MMIWFLSIDVHWLVKSCPIEKAEQFHSFENDLESVGEFVDNLPHSIIVGHLKIFGRRELWN